MKNLRIENKAELLGCLWLFVSLATAITMFVVYIDNPITERHHFRQTQTAFGILGMVEDGLTLRTPLPVFGVPWALPMEFPLYQVIAATVSKIAGLNHELAGRVVSFFFFLLCLFPLFSLAKSLGLHTAMRWTLLCLFLVCPLHLLWGRSVLPETTALCFSLVFFAAFVRLIESKNDRKFYIFFLIALTAGIIAGLAKITTFCVFFGTALLYAGSHIVTGRFTWRKCVSAGLVLAAPIFVGLVWTDYSNAIKAENGLTVGLTSGNLRSWNFGTIELRSSQEYWESFYQHGVKNVIPVVVLIVSGLSLAFLSTRRLAVKRFSSRGDLYEELLPIVLFGGFLSGPLVFANLYRVHDYYWVANATFLLLFITKVLSLLILGLQGRFNRWQKQLKVVPAVFGSVLVAFAIGYFFSHPYYGTLKYASDNDSREGEDIRGFLQERGFRESNSVLLHYGFKGNPVLPYYVRGKSISLSNANLLEEYLIEVDRAKSAGYEISGLLISLDLDVEDETVEKILGFVGISDPSSMEFGRSKIFVEK